MCEDEKKNQIGGNLRFFKTLDVNKYATKKTIAQGLLDVALLTANASQLKYVLQVGEKHEFYVLMLTLIIVSIVLQVLQAILCVLLGSKLDINKENHQDDANKANNIILCLNIVVMATNILISAFEMKEGTDHIDGSVMTTSSLVAKCVENDT
ncbi:unnamed protein product [Callosobruchus maculatus]|uniref:Uncharacterized protein n=1 Tax=Callosobruchus maculatus TaxID=64391 RepID=A0A653CMD3_CALMS|nr:unnamed protein product [Callosobruchus maculatus]